MSEVRRPRVLWQGTPGPKVWRLGDRTEVARNRDMPSQGIDHVWDDDGDHLGHVTNCNHTDKIVVNGHDCTELATRLVTFLNAGAPR